MGNLMSARKAPVSLRSLEVQAGLAGALAMTLCATAAQAQTSVTNLDGITVARKRPNLSDYVDPQAPYKIDRSASNKMTEPLLDTPKSVSVLAKDIIDDLGANTFRDLLRTQPGITLGTGEGGNAYGDRFFIRGFEARNDVYIDGVRDPGVGAREVFGIEQIEILKGPSSTIGGRGATGGAVSLISKQPLDMPFHDLETTFGDDGTRRVTLDWNQPISDTFKVRGNLMYHEGGVAGRNAVFNDRKGWAGAASWQPIEPLHLAIDYFHLETNEMPDFGVPYDLALNMPFEVDRNNFYGVVARDFRKTFADIYTAKADWSVNDAVSMHAVYRYGQTLNAYTASAPEGPNAALRTVNANAKRRDAVTDTWSGHVYADARFETGPLSHTLVVGVEGGTEDVYNRGRAFLECATLPCTGAASGVVQNLDRPNPYLARAVTDNGITSRTHTVVDSLAAYAIDTIKLGERFNILLGLRHDRFDLDYRSVATATGVATTRGNKTEFWNYNLGLTYKPAPNASLYAAYATSSNPSGEQLDSAALDYGGLDARTVNLDAERNRSAEIGAKWSLMDDNLSLTAAAFTIRKENARVAVNATTVLLAGEQQVDGFELGASGNITPRWNVFAGLQQIDARITDSPTVAQIGAKFPNIPDRSVSMTSKYQVTRRLTLGGTATYNGPRAGGTTTALSTSIPGYTRFDLFGNIRITQRLLIDFNILNLTDKVYYDALYRSATPFTYIAPGRSMIIKIDYHF
jgi:catecholate siderophore receptor